MLRWNPGFKEIGRHVLEPTRIHGLAVACVTAAAGGAFMATRQNGATEKPAVIETPAAPVEASTKPVQETEAVVSPAPAAAVTPAPAPAPAKPAPATPRKREDARQPAKATSKPADTTTARNTPLPTLDRGWPSTPAPQTPSAPTVDQAPPTACHACRRPSGGRATSRAGASADGLRRAHGRRRFSDWHSHGDDGLERDRQG